MDYHVVEARHIGGHTLWLRFRDGTAGEIDLLALRGPVMEPLKDVNVFAQFRIDAEFTHLCGQTAPTCARFFTITFGSRPTRLAAAAGSAPYSALALGVTPVQADRFYGRDANRCNAPPLDIQGFERVDENAAKVARAAAGLRPVRCDGRRGHRYGVADDSVVIGADRISRGAVPGHRSIDL
jgi:hypothetical protein